MNIQGHMQYVKKLERASESPGAKNIITYYQTLEGQLQKQGA